MDIKKVTLKGINLTPTVALALRWSLTNMSSVALLGLDGEDEKDIVNMDA